MGKQQNKPGIPVVKPISDAAYQPTPDLAQPNFNVDGSPRSLDDLWNAGIARNRTDYIEQLPLKDMYIGGRYNNTIPGTDYESTHGAQQSGLEQAFNGVVKGVNLAGTTVLGGFGTLYGVGKAVLPGGKLSDIWDNEIMQSLDEWNKKVDEEWLPNYYSAKETNSKWYETDNWFTTNFLFDKLIKNSGFAVGAMISGNIANAGLMRTGTAIASQASKLEKLAKAKKGFESFTPLLRNTSRAFSQGKNIEAATILEKEITSMADLSLRAKSLSELATQTNKFVNLSNNFRRSAVALYSSAGEANFEALQSSNEYRESLIQAYIDANGVHPTGEELAEIDGKVNRLGATAFIGNMALLGVTEWFQLPYLMGSTYRTTKSAANRFVRETGEITFDEAGKAMAKPKNWAEKSFGRLYKGSRYIIDPKEAFQEMGQFALQVGSENYYDKAYETGEADWWVDGVLHGFFGRDNETGEGVGAFVSKEGIEGGIMGMLTGGFMQGRQKYVADRTKATNTQNFIEELNNSPTFKDAYKQKLRDANRGIALAELQEEAIKQGNELEAKDIRHDMMFNYMYNKIKYGRKDLIAADFDMMISKGSTTDGLNELKEEGFANIDDTITTFTERANRMKEFMNKIELMAGNINQVYAGQVVTDSEGNTKPAYSEAVIEKMTYAASKIADYDVRIPQLEANLGNKNIVNTQNILDNLDNAKALDEARIEEEIKIESALENRQVRKDEALKLAKELDDYVELQERKKYFYNEYNDMISNPAKYDVPEADIQVPTEQTPITVTTKNGDREVMLGKEYRLGTVVKYDKNNKQVFRAPTLTIIEQKEDGTLVVQDTKGKVSEVTPEQLEDYDLIDPEKTTKTENFFLAHWNDVFIHQGIKHTKGKRKGKPIEGRLQLTKDHKGLNFVFINDQGKKKVVPLENSHFIADKAKGFTMPRVRKVGEVTPAQQTATNELISESGFTEDVAPHIDKRNKILDELFDQLSDKQKKADKLIAAKKKQIEKNQKELNKLKGKIREAKADKRVKGTFRFKTEARKALQKAMQLSNMQRQLENEIEQLEDQISDIDVAQQTILNIVDNLEKYSEKPTEFLEELQFDLLNIEEAKEKTVKQIDAIKDLISSTKAAIKSAVKYLENLINKFEAKNPDIPLFIGKRFMDNADNLLQGEIQNLLDTIELTEEQVIVPDEARVEQLEEHYEMMMEDMVVLDRQHKAMQVVIEKFEEVAANWKLQKVEEAVFGDNEALAQELIDTQEDSGTPISSAEENQNYEPEDKKEQYNVVLSTKPFSGRINPLTEEWEEPREHHKRANRFGFRFESLDNKEDIQGVVLNQKTEAGIADGLMEHLAGDSGVDPSDTLAFLMVVNTREGLRPVDEFGNPIMDGKDVLNRAVYQVFPKEDKDGKLTAYYKGKKQSMFRNTADSVDALTEKYIAWREKEVNKEERSPAEAVKVSFGVPTYATYLDENGEEQRDYAVRTNVKDAGLADENRLGNEDVLLVGTTNDTITQGTTSFTNALGRVFLRSDNGLTRLDNRKHTPEEAEVIFDVLFRLAQIAQDKKSLKGEEVTRLTNWLKSVVYWGHVKDQDGKVKKKGYNSIWFDWVVNDATNKKEPRLFFSKSEQSVALTPTSLNGNKNSILHILEQMYLNVDAKRVNEASFNAAYIQITGIDSKGQPITKKWPNYQSYLLSDKSPDSKGQLTQNRTTPVPLATNLSPITPTSPVNRNGIYFTRVGGMEEMYVEPESKAAPPTATPEATETAEKEEKSVEEVLETTESEKQGYTLDGVENNLFTLKNKDTVFFKMDLAKAKEVFEELGVNLKDSISKIKFVQQLLARQILDVQLTTEIIKARAKEKNIPELQAAISIGVDIFNDLSINFSGITNTKPVEYVPKKPNMDGKESNVIDVDGLGKVVYTFDMAKAQKLLEADTLSDPDKRAEFILKLFQEGILNPTADTKVVTKVAENTGKTPLQVVLKAVKTIFKQVEPHFVLEERPTDETIEAPKKPETPKDDKTKKVKEFKVGDRVVDKNYNVWEIISLKEWEAETRIPEMKSGIKARFIENVHPNEKKREILQNPDSTQYIEPGSVNTLPVNMTATLSVTPEIVESDTTNEETETDNFADGLDYSQFEDEDEKGMRALLNNQETSTVTPENWKEVEAWLKNKFPNLPVFRVKKMIEGTDGSKNWGMFHKGALYIYENAETGTVYHEVFEAVWKMFTTPEERAQIMNEFRFQEGTFTDRFTGKEYEYATAPAERIKEELAEEFRDKVQFNINPRRKKGNLITRIFNDIINAIKNFVFGKKARTNIEQLFEKIEGGQYARYSPYAAKLSYAQVGIQDIATAKGDQTSAYRAAINEIPAQQQHDIMQEMTYQVLRKLITDNETLFSLNETTFNKQQLYKELKMKVIGKVGAMVNTLAKQINSGEKTAEENNPRIDTNKHLINLINREWPNIVSNHEELLRQYEITFDENDELEIRNYEKSKNDPYGSAIKRDQYRKASYAVKFLLGSLPRVDASNNILKSSINGAQLIPSDKVVIDLKNQLYDAVDVEEMFDRLGKIAIKNPNYANLYKRLTNNPPSEFADLSNVDERGWELIGGFWKLMKSQHPDVLAVFVMSDSVQIGDSALAGAARAAKRTMIMSMIEKIKKGSDFFDYNRQTGKYTSSDLIKKKQLNRSAPQSYTQFLEHFNIDIKATDITSKLTDNQKRTFFEAVDGILLSMKNIEDMVNISTTTLDIDGNLMKLGTIQAIIENPEFESTYFNINNEKAQTYIGTNALSNIYHVLSNSKIKKFEDLKGTAYNYLRTDSFAKGSLILDKIFNMSGNGAKRKNSDLVLKPVYIDGTVDQRKGKKKQSSKLTYRQRFLQELNLNLDGVYMNLVPGDASLEHATRLHNSRDPFVTLEEVQAKTYDQIFEDYFKAEVELVRDERIVDSRHNNKELRFFKEILMNGMDKKRYNALMTAINKKTKTKGYTVSIEEILKEYKKDIIDSVELFITQEAQDTEAMLNQFGAIVYTDEGIDVTELKAEPNSLLAENTELDADSLRSSMKAVAINYMIANIELHKVLYSDPYQYGDELKRIKNFNSPRQPLMTVSKNVGKVLHKLYNKNFAKDDIGYTDMHRNHFRTITFEDVVHQYGIPGYEGDTYDETDGAGIITLKSYRKYAILANQWSTDNERQYRYEIAWEKKHKKLKLTDNDKKVLAEGDPKIKSTFTPLKPIVSGNKANGRNYNDTVLDKYALMAFSYRTLYEINPEANALNLYDRMMDEDIDYVVFKSARKVGAEQVLPLYDKDGNVTTAEFTEITNPNVPHIITNIPFDIMSVQSEVPSKDTHKITRGSQITKLATLDYMQAGVPIDFMQEEDNFEKRWLAWAKLEDKTSYNNGDNLYNLIQRNQQLLEAKTKLGYRQLLKEFGIKETVSGYTLVDRKKLINTLKGEMLKREINHNISSAFDEFEKGEVVLEATPAYQQIRHILYSIADSRVVSPKITGGFKVQIPATLLESKKIKPEKINGKDAYVSDTLKFYEDEDGKRVCEIMVARWFKSDKTDEELLNEWYVLDKDGNRTSELTEKGKKILSGIGFRIPTQKQNSIDSFVIKKLLPETLGDSVVVPSQIVQKVGSDFDIDKLSIYLKNVLSNPDGTVSIIEYQDDSNSTIAERYNQYIRGEVKEYREIREEVERDSIEYSQLRETINNYYNEFLSKVNEAKEDFILPLSNELNNLQELIQNKKSASKEIYSMGYKIFKTLSPGLQDSFYNLDSVMNSEVVNGKMSRWEKTLRFKSHAEDWIADITENEIIYDWTTPKGVKMSDTIELSEINKLKALIANYDLFLAESGFTSETITQHKAKLDSLKQNKKEYHKVKDAERSGLSAVKSKLYQAFNEEFNKTLAEEFDLMSMEEFGQQNMDLQNSKQALENEYIQSLQDLVSHPLNFNNLVKPNSADPMKKIAKAINRDLGRTEIDYSSPGNMMRRRFMSGLRQAFVSGKYAIGIAAVNQTNHSLMQRFVSYLNTDRILDESIISSEDRYWLKVNGGEIMFKNKNTVTVGGKLYTTFSGITNAVGENISDIVGMFIDGYVDISAGPWIMEIGATPTTASTWLTLIKAGVPVEEVAYFMNQPIIREYLQMLDNAGYSWLFIDDYVDLFLEKYEPSNPVEITEMPSLATMKKTIKMSMEDMQKDDSTLAQQQFILKEFMKYSMMASHMFRVTQGTNFDTANFNDGFLIFKKRLQLEYAKNTIISSAKVENDKIVYDTNAADAILNNSFLGTLKDMLYNVRNAMSEVLISDRPSKTRNGISTRSVLEKVLLPYVQLPDREFLKVSKRAVNDLFDWFVFNKRGLNGAGVIAEILLGTDTAASAASQIMDFKKQVENTANHTLHGNIILDSIQYESGSNKNKPDNLMIVRKENKVYDQNLVIAAFRELRDYLGTEKGGLYGKLVRLALLQSGSNNSRISFSSLLPFEDFIEVYKVPLSEINKSEEISHFVQLDVFQRNNWNNDTLVPFKRETMIPYEDRYGRQRMFKPNSDKVHKNFKLAMNKKIIPKVININMFSREAASDIIVYNWEVKPTITDEDRAAGIKTIKAKKAAMKKAGDRSYSKKALMKKVYIRDKNNQRVPLEHQTKGKGDKVYYNHVYKAINAWGDGTRAVEMYGKLHPDSLMSTVGRSGVLDNGFEKYIEVEDEVIEDIFNQENMIDLQQEPMEMAFSEENQKKIISGEKTMTTRNNSEHSGIYSIRGRKFLITPRDGVNGYMDVQDAGGALAVVKAEALPTKATKRNKYPVSVDGTTYFAMYQSTVDFINGETRKYVFDIKDVTDEVAQDKLDTEERVAANVAAATSPLAINIYSTDKNGFEELSNFSNKRPYTDSSGRKFATVEAAYQFSKSHFATGNNDTVKRQILKSTTGAQAKALGKKIQGLNKELWDKNAGTIMYRIIKDSFLQNPDQIPLLMSTGDAILTHISGPKTDKWTTLFPRILTQVRSELSLENINTDKNKPTGLPEIDRTNENC